MIQLAFKTHLTKIYDRKCFQNHVAALSSGFTRKTVNSMWCDTCLGSEDSP